MKILITCGPTREYIDQVRCITNKSTGYFGIALAEEAVCRGHQVVLISGSKEIWFPGIIYVETTQEMLVECKKQLVNSDVLIMNAAVADFKMRKFISGKIKKRSAFSIQLTENTDILTELSKLKKNNQIFVGFALEERKRGRPNALKKLRSKSLDMIVLNYLNSFGNSTLDGEIHTYNEKIVQIRNSSKYQVSSKIIQLISSL